jgi:hypothetical protein
LFDTEWQDGELHYVTRWVPNMPVILAVAVCYDAGFTHRYEETGNQIYGQTLYADGEIGEAELEEHDFSQYTYDEQREIYCFEGQEFDSDTEILDILLERKLQACGLAG